MIKDHLKNVLKENARSSNLYKRNLLKEILQIYVLDFIYAHKDYKDLVFYGGSCLSQCYDLPRLSEDLDFVDIAKRIDLKKMASDIETYFNAKTDLRVETRIQKFRIYLKFPILEELGLAKDRSETNFLILKVEVFKGFDFCKDPRIEVIALFKANRSLFVKTFDLPTLMATKIRAVLKRKWEKTDRQGKTLLSVKGRDYFDLLWYLGKKIKPDYKCIDSSKTPAAIKKELLSIIEKVDEKSIALDLEHFIEDQQYLGSLSENIKGVLTEGIRKM